MWVLCVAFGFNIILLFFFQLWVCVRVLGVLCVKGKWKSSCSNLFVCVKKKTRGEENVLKLPVSFSAIISSFCLVLCVLWVCNFFVFLANVIYMEYGNNWYCLFRCQCDNVLYSGCSEWCQPLSDVEWKFEKLFFHKVF